jgi:hypothetical protein
MPMNIGQRKKLRSTLKDKDSVENMFDILRQIVIENLSSLETSENYLKDSPQQKFILSQSRRLFSDMNCLMDIIEAITLNALDERDSLLNLTNIYLSTEKERKPQLTELSNKVRQQENEIKEFQKHKAPLEWLDDYFKHSSETSTQ